MNFNRHLTLYEELKPQISLTEFYDRIRNYRSNSPEEFITCVSGIIEQKWYSEMRPYYKVWPAIQDALFKINLDCEFSALQLKEQVVLIRFCAGSEPRVEDKPIKYILTAYGLPIRLRKEDVFDFHVLIGYEVNGELVQRVTNCAVEPGHTIEQIINCRETSLSFSPDMQSGSLMLSGAFKCALTTMILGSDPTFVRPDVLAADREKFDKTGDMKYVEKAKRRGIVGFRLGEEYETIPHYRRPHLGLRWTEKGRAVPKIVPIKGAIVHREKMTKVPTGYITPENVEVEPQI